MSKPTFHLLLISCLATGGLWAANAPFIGKWRLNPSKSSLERDPLLCERLNNLRTVPGVDPSLL